MSAPLPFIMQAVDSPNLGVCILPIRFRFNGASASTTFTGSDHIVSSVARSGAGIWTVTLKEAFKNWQGVVCAQASLEIDAASDESFCQLGPMDESAGTIVVRVFTESAGTLAAADIAAGSNDGNWCHILLMLKYSKAIDGSGIPA